MKFLPVGVATIVLAAITGCASTAHQPVVVDGRVEEWSPLVASIADPVGDASGATDVVELAAQRWGEFVYLRLRVADPTNLQKPAENGGLRIEVKGESEIVALDTAQRQVERDGQPVPWASVGYLGLPTHAAREFEVRMRAPRGALTIETSGSDSLPMPLTLAGTAAEAPTRIQSVRRGDSALRVVSWNVLHGGPFKDRQREAAARDVLSVLSPDVLLLQEVWDVPELAKRVHEVCGEDWSVYELGGVAVASRLPMTALALDPPVALDDRRRPKGGDCWSVMRNLFVGIDTPVGPIIAVSAHWKCCGQSGSKEDVQRMDDALTALKAIWRLRDAAVPAKGRRGGSRRKPDVPKRFANAPLVIAGDYNLVGSRAPLDMLLASGLEELFPLRNNEWSASTWRSIGDAQIGLGGAVGEDWKPGGFPPGRLDIAVVDRDLDVANAFVADLGESTLLSDHLPVVMDFAGPKAP